MGLAPKDPDGLTAWDYAGGIWREVYKMRELLQDQGEQAQLRWLNLVGDAYAGGGLTSTGRLVVPVGARWTALAVSGSSGSVGADTVELFRNSAEDKGFITRLTGVGGRFNMVNLPDNLQLEEGTVLIARFTILAAADGAFPTVNIATRQVIYGNPPRETEEGGESIARVYGDAGDEFPDRTAQVDYAAEHH